MAHMADGAPQGGTDLGRRIREYRERAGLSQEEAAARVGMAGYLGFQVRRTGCDPYAQVRMAGRIAGFDRRARPRCGRVHRGCCARCGRPRASWDGVPPSESLNLQRPALMTHSDHAPNDLVVARSVDPPASRQRLNDRQTSPFWRVRVLLCWHRQNEGLVPYQDRDLLAIRPEEETDKVTGRVRNPIGD